MILVKPSYEIMEIMGNVIYTSLPTEILNNSLKELEIRFMIGSLQAPEMYYSLETGQKIFSQIVEIPWKLEPLIIVALYNRHVPLGLAEINQNKLKTRIKNII